MKITFFSAQPYDREVFYQHHADTRLELIFLEERLNDHTATLARGSEVVCVFVNDVLDAANIKQLAEMGIKLITLRCAGFNNVDLKAACANDIKVTRVPAYSPNAVAEHALAMLMTLNRKTHKAYNRVREQNFSLNGLLGFDVCKKTIGVIGTGNIGTVFCQIMHGFGSKILACDPYPNTQIEKLGISYVSLDEIFAECDIISLHCPLNEATHHIINAATINKMKNGVMLINTSRGGLIDTHSVIASLKSGHIGCLGIDVYEQEEHLFFQDLSEQVILDDQITRLIGFQNVLITAHQGFFTKEAINEIAQTTFTNISSFLDDKKLENEIKYCG
ncbi:MAG: 2-hydroxyacid dehydrogenase [Thiohalomonadaceae bacterium]